MNRRDDCWRTISRISGGPCDNLQAETAERPSFSGYDELGDWIVEHRYSIFCIEAVVLNVADYSDYFAHAVRLARPGTVIVVDNVVRGGAVIDASSGDAAVQGVRRLVDVVAAEPRVSATVIQTVGSKGHDGYLLARVTD